MFHLILDLNVTNHEREMKVGYRRVSTTEQNFDRQELGEVEKIFARHNLNALAVAKPGLITKRVNNGTNKVFEGIEDDTKNISNLDTSTNDK